MRPFVRRLLPTTRLGRWSGYLLAAFFVLFVTLQLLVASGQRGGDTFLDNPVLSVTASLQAICAIAAGVLGVMAVVRQKERSPVVFAAIVLGALLSLFIVGEFTLPH